MDDGLRLLQHRLLVDGGFYAYDDDRPVGWIDPTPEPIVQREAPGFETKSKPSTYITMTEAAFNQAEEQNRYSNVRIECDICGAIVRPHSIYSHKRSRVHLAYLEVNNRFSQLLINDKNSDKHI